MGRSLRNCRVLRSTCELEVPLPSVQQLDKLDTQAGSRSLSGVLGFRLARDRIVRAILTALFALGLRGLPETRASIGSHKWWTYLSEGLTANCITI